eukprot:CAMPEP_0171062090 /NCGR_PEP_ID=MMETSP0766_2-20121228/4861_1 /TAXON_ID=439317 /ORGANISM="Gambierdiscus australes, Strain CAWD 149" /LENGTH=370 /DNA_ID=CAMNT_0011517863 /DNA_START=65 /DNA_END=1176 /DNA_ORIENTATION=+
MKYAGLTDATIQGGEDVEIDQALVQEAMSAPAPRNYGRKVAFGALLLAGALAAVATLTTRSEASAAMARGSIGELIGLSEEEAPQETTVKVVLRDFWKHNYSNGHPDMEPADSAVRAGLVKGLVEDTLGSDKKPVYKGGKALSTKENFDQWYNDVPSVNKRVESEIVLAPNGAGKLEYDKHDFFPVDGKGWKDIDTRFGHNYYFTLEAHWLFTYNGGETFTFRGDDDLWVFINDKLVIDLGGMHEPETGSVDLDSLSLTKGSDNVLSMFFAERHTKDSNFRVETSIRLDKPPEPPQCCLLNLVVTKLGCADMDKKFGITFGACRHHVPQQQELSCNKRGAWHLLGNTPTSTRFMAAAAAALALAATADAG